MDSPISAAVDKRLYFNTTSDLIYIDNGHVIGLTDYPKHFIMACDLSNTQQTSHDLIHPDLTHSSISNELNFLWPYQAILRFSLLEKTLVQFL